METTKRILRDVSIVVQLSALSFIISILIINILNLFLLTHYVTQGVNLPLVRVHIVINIIFSVVFSISIWYFFLRTKSNEKVQDATIAESNTNKPVPVTVKMFRIVGLLAAMFLVFPQSRSFVPVFGCSLYNLFSGSLSVYLVFISLIGCVYVVYRYARCKDKLPFFDTVPSFRFQIFFIICFLVVELALSVAGRRPCGTPIPGMPTTSTPIYLTVPIISKLLSL